MLMKLADWAAFNLFCRSLFLSSASLHSLCFYIIWFAKSSLASSLIGGRWFVPYFIVQLNCVFKWIVLIKSIVRARQLLHCATHSQPGWLCLALRDRPTWDASSYVFLAIFATDLRLSLNILKYARSYSNLLLLFIFIYLPGAIYSFRRPIELPCYRACTDQGFPGRLHSNDLIWGFS